MCEVKCPHKHNCTSHPHKCNRCKNNTGKRDYFRPDPPCYPQYPYYYPYTWPYTGWWTITSGDDGGWTNITCNAGTSSNADYFVQL